MIKIVVFDDDKWSCDDIAKVIKAYMNEECSDVLYELAVFLHPNELENWLDSNRPDIAFLDICVEANENYGLDIARHIRKLNKEAHIIFITSAFENIKKVFSGLIRPSRFMLKDEYRYEIAEVLKEIMKERFNRADILRVSYGRNEYILDIANIILIQKEGRKTLVSLVDRQINVTDSLSSIAFHLPNHFIQIDKGILVNIKMVREADYPKKTIRLLDGRTVYMSRNSVHHVKSALNGLL